MAPRIEHPVTLDDLHATKDYRWIRKDGTRCTWKETLQAAARCCYGGGRWHHREYWLALQEQVPGMTEEECEAEMRAIEQRADERLEQWKMYQ